MSVISLKDNEGPIWLIVSVKLQTNVAMMSIKKALLV